MAAFSYYVYYRVAPGTGRRERDRVRAAQAEVAATGPLMARLLSKRDEPDLWMEVYEGVADATGFERVLAAAVLRHGLEQFLDLGSVRKIECFTVPECA